MSSVNANMRTFLYEIDSDLRMAFCRTLERSQVFGGVVNLSYTNRRSKEKESSTSPTLIDTTSFLRLHGKRVDLMQTISPEDPDPFH